MSGSFETFSTSGDQQLCVIIHFTVKPNHNDHSTVNACSCDIKFSVSKWTVSNSVWVMKIGSGSLMVAYHLWHSTNNENLNPTNFRIFNSFSYKVDVGPYSTDLYNEHFALTPL